MSASAKRDGWKLRLYVVEGSSLAEQAVRNAERTCEEFVPGNYELEVIDLGKEPERAVEDDIVAIPTVVRISPGPKRRVIGVADVGKLAAALNLRREDRGE